MPEGSLFHVPRAARRAPGSILRASAIGLQRVYSAARTSFLDSNFSLGLNDIDMYVIYVPTAAAPHRVPRRIAS